MFAHINELSIIVASLLTVAVGSIWYSPLLCGNVWVRAREKVIPDESLSRWELISLALRAVVVCFALFSLATWIYEKSHVTYPFLFSSGVTTSIIIIHLLLISLWEKRPITYVLVHGGYAVLSIFMGLGVILYWPW